MPICVNRQRSRGPSHLNELNYLLMKPSSADKRDASRERKRALPKQSELDKSAENIALNARLIGQMAIPVSALNELAAAGFSECKNMWAATSAMSSAPDSNLYTEAVFVKKPASDDDVIRALRASKTIVVHPIRAFRLKCAAQPVMLFAQGNVSPAFGAVLLVDAEWRNRHLPPGGWWPHSGSILREWNVGNPFEPGKNYDVDGIINA